MISSKAFLYSFILFFTLTSFFWDDDEKDIRRMHYAAESSMQAKAYHDAKKTYCELLTRFEKRHEQRRQVDWGTYATVILRFAEACEALGEQQDGRKELEKFLSRRPPEEYLAKAKFWLARLSSDGNPHATSYVEMKRVFSSYPQEPWKGQDLSYYRALEFALDTRYDELLRKAKRFFTAGFYAEAVPLYQEIIQAIEASSYPKGNLSGSLILKKARYKLAECNFHMELYDKSLSIINEEKSTIDNEAIFLAALCYREKKEYEKALGLFQQYAQMQGRADMDHYAQALFEIGFYYYQSQHLSKARPFFERIAALNHAGKPKIVALLYLAKISLQENTPNDVESFLSHFSKELSLNDPLLLEAYYLRGVAQYNLRNYAAAMHLLEQALNDRSRSEWRLDALYHLGWSFIKQGEANKNKTLFKKAQGSFISLLNSSKHEAAVLSLAKLYILLGAVQIATDLLEQHMPSLSLEGQHMGLMMQAEAATTDDEKKMWLKKASNPIFESLSSFASSLHSLGLVFLDEGIKSKNMSCFEKAAKAFEKAFKLFEKKHDERKAATVLKLGAKTALYQNATDSSLALLEKLLQQYNETIEEREETLYLKGLAAAQVYFPIAEESLRQVSILYPQGKYAADALHILGTVYFQKGAFEKAEEAFSRIASHYPSSPLAGDALFWEARAQEKLGKDPSFLFELVFERYPHCDKAPIAYFRGYPHQDYLEGNEKAMAHLQNFIALYPKSPLCSVALYFIGAHATCKEVRKESFEEGLRLFSRSLIEGVLPDPSYVYFRYQTMLELAEVHFEEENHEKGLNLLQTIIDNFSDKNHPLASILARETLYPPILERCEFSLAKHYIKLGKTAKAEHLFCKMLAHYEEADIREGDYLSAVWREQGKLAMQSKNHKTALECFNIAEECAGKEISNETKYILWILQSDCYKTMGAMNQALSLLIRVIETEESSPLQLEAMHKCAAIYEEQTHFELASLKENTHE